MSKLYLDLIVNFNCMLVMLARTPDLKAICLTVKAVNAVSDKSEWKAACDLICKLSSRPLLAAYKWLKPFQKCLRNSLLSSIYVLYLKQKASSEQWKAEDFLALSNMLQSTDHDSTYVSLSLSNNDMYKSSRNLAVRTYGITCYGSLSFLKNPLIKSHQYK